MTTIASASLIPIWYKITLNWLNFPTAPLFSGNITVGLLISNGKCKFKMQKVKRKRGIKWVFNCEFVVILDKWFWQNHYRLFIF